MKNYVPIDQRFLMLEGKVSDSSLNLIKTGLPSERPLNSEILFVSYAFDDVPVGKTFSIIFPKDSPNDGIYCQSKIIAVTQQFGMPLEVIPHGWKTICIVEFIHGIPEIINSLPTMDSWSFGDYICICDEDAWDAIKNR